VVELPQAHLGADVLAHGNHGNTEDGDRLVRRVFLLLVEVVVAVVEHALDLEDVAGAGIGADVDEDRGLLGDRVRDRLENLNRRVRGILALYSVTKDAWRSADQPAVHCKHVESS
jgi:hypothetical protein